MGHVETCLALNLCKNLFFKNPVFIGNTEDPQNSLEQSTYRPIWDVLNALKSHDDILSTGLDQLRTNLGRKHYKDKIKDIPKIIIDLPKTVDESFAESLKTALIEQTTASWNFWFGLLEDYVQNNGHTRVNQKFKTKDDFKLGFWVANQRWPKDQLNDEQISRLDAIGFVWNTFKNFWERGFSHLEKFVEKEGHARVPTKYVTDEGFNLGKWINKQRSREKNLSSEQISRLNKLGFDWDPRNTRWEKGFSHLEKYVQKEGHAKVPKSFVTDDEFRLGSWVNRLRQRRDLLNDEQICRLDAIGFVWNNLNNAWERGFSHLEKYVQKEGHAKVPFKYESEDEFRFGAWVNKQRSRKNRLTSEQISRLDEVGFYWKLRKTKNHLG